MDAIDIKILDHLQQDAAMPLADLAARVGLSATPCWRRIKALEEAGVIAGRVALLDPDRLNLPVTVFVSIRTHEHNAAWLTRFAKAVAGIPEIVDVYRMSGDVDYLLRVVVPDVAGYDAVYKKLIKVGGLTDVSSRFAMERIKASTRLPLNYLPIRRRGA